jgi:hypothetical protein
MPPILHRDLTSKSSLDKISPMSVINYSNGKTLRNTATVKSIFNASLDLAGNVDLFIFGTASSSDLMKKYFLASLSNDPVGSATLAPSEFVIIRKVRRVGYLVCFKFVYFSSIPRCPPKLIL